SSRAASRSARSCASSRCWSRYTRSDGTTRAAASARMHARTIAFADMAAVQEPRGGAASMRGASLAVLDRADDDAAPDGRAADALRPGPAGGRSVAPVRGAPLRTPAGRLGEDTPSLSRRGRRERGCRARFGAESTARTPRFGDPHAPIRIGPESTMGAPVRGRPSDAEVRLRVRARERRLAGVAGRVVQLLLDAQELV